MLEILITLVIMGVISALTIPSLVEAPTSQKNKYSSINHDVALMVLQAYEKYKISNPTVATTVSMANLTPYLNYVSVDSSAIIDNTNGSTTASCVTNRCLKLHNGAMFYYYAPAYFNGNNTTNAIYYYLDPDGKQTDSTTNGPGKSILVWLQYDGSMHSWGTLPTTVSVNINGNMTYPPVPSADPVWFSGF